MSRNRQLFPTATVHSCKFCGTEFTVQMNRNRTGEFCSAKCAHTFAGRKPRPKATKAWRRAQREAESAAWKKDLADRAAALDAKLEAESAARKVREEELKAESFRRAEEARLDDLAFDLELEAMRRYEAQVADEIRRAPRPVKIWTRK